jgi:thiol-disulfide isomerase/thioredoxin
MKVIIQKVILFSSLAIAVSSLAGCGGSDNSSPNNAASNAGPNNTSAANSSTSSTSASLYPPLASSVAQAEIESLDGSTFKPADRKGNVLLMNLWGVWCGPCKAEMPHLVQMQDKYRDKGFQIIGLNVGDENNDPEKVDKIKEFAGEMKLNYELARIPRNVTQEFMKVTKFDAVPQSIVVDREGRLRGVFLGGGSNVINKMRETVDRVVNEQ